MPHVLCNQLVYLQFSTVEEANQIHQQFHDPSFYQNRQVLWSGILREVAKQWADQRGMQTLTTVMGSLMQTDHPSCLKSKKTPKGWSKYVKGASAIFAHYAADGQVITVLSPPPPVQFHPSGLTNFQTIEVPILKGRFAGSAVGRIELVHPGVSGAEDFRYQFWPKDEVFSWMERFGTVPVKRVQWRQVKLRSYRALGLNAQELVSCGDTVPDEAPQSRSFLVLLRTDGERLHDVQNVVPSRTDDRGDMAVEEQINQMLARSTQMTAKKEPIPIKVTGKLVTPTTIKTNGQTTSKEVKLAPVKTPKRVMKGTAKKKAKKARKAKPVVRQATGKMANTTDRSKLTKTENANKASCMKSGIQNGLEKCEKESKTNAKEAKPKHY
jgi:hypothetical protein